MKKQNSLFLFVMIAALVGIISITTSISYSYISRISVGENIYRITTDNLSSNIVYTSSNENIMPLSNGDGLNQNSYGIIEISKDNAYTVFYTINIGYSLSLPDGKSTSDLVPLDYVNVALYEMDGDTVSQTPVVGPVRIIDLTLDYVDPSSIYNDKYLLSYDMFTSGSDSAKYALKVWVDETIPSSYNNGLVYLNVGVNEYTKLSKSFFNITGYVYTDSVALANATIKIQNANNESSLSRYTPVYAVSNSDGSYVLHNIPEGTYTLSITSGSDYYESVVHFETGASESVVTVSNGSVVSTDYLQNGAYTYYSTPGMIKRSNSITDNTNQAATGTYTIPSSYRIIGIDSYNTIALSNINLTASSGSVIVSRQV